jgi:hypothetical protein
MVQGAFKSTNLLGGMPNLIKNNLERASQAIDFTNKIESERSFAANVKAGPQYNIRVPLQLGIECTVGKGATFNLLPPVGDQGVMGYDPNGGLMLLTDLMHEVWNDLREVRGTTTFQAMKGSFSF